MPSNQSLYEASMRKVEVAVIAYLTKMNARNSGVVGQAGVQAFLNANGQAALATQYAAVYATYSQIGSVPPNVTALTNAQSLATAIEAL